MKRRLALAASILVAAGLAGCVVAPVAPPYQPTPAGGDVYADVPPPPAQAEYIGPPPAVGYVWIGGNWAAPRAGYRWVPYGWAPYGPRWRLGGGYWSR